PNVRFMQGDLCETPAANLLEMTGDPSRKFDVVLSDMAPSTSGDHSADHFRSVRLCLFVVERCATILKPSGKLVMKAFEGSEYPELLRRVSDMFEASKGFKPKASRSESTEMYVVATGFRGAESFDARGGGDDSALPQRKPASGWSR